MKAITDNPKVPASKPEPKPKSPKSKSGSKPDATNPKHDLKTLPMPEVEKQLGASPDGLSQMKPRSGWRNTVQQDRGKENQRIPEVSQLFLGPHSVDD